MAASSKHMLVIVGVADPLVVIERDRALGDIDREFAIGAVIVLPAAMRFFEEIVSDLLDSIPDRERRPLDLGPAPAGLRHLDLRVRQVDKVLANLGFDASTWPLSPPPSNWTTTVV